MSSGESSCANNFCGRTTSLIWHRRDYKGVAQAKLCKGCAKHFDRDQFCGYCDQIYRQRDSDLFDGKKWIECSECLRWSHVACEVNAGYRIALEAYLAKDREDFSYQCRGCRGHGEYPHQHRANSEPKTPFIAFESSKTGKEGKVEENITGSSSNRIIHEEARDNLPLAASISALMKKCPLKRRAIPSTLKQISKKRKKSVSSSSSSGGGGTVQDFSMIFLEAAKEAERREKATHTPTSPRNLMKKSEASRALVLNHLKNAEVKAEASDQRLRPIGESGSNDNIVTCPKLTTILKRSSSATSALPSSSSSTPSKVLQQLKKLAGTDVKHSQQERHRHLQTGRKSRQGKGPLHISEVLKLVQLAQHKGIDLLAMKSKILQTKILQTRRGNLEVPRRRPSSINKRKKKQQVSGVVQFYKNLTSFLRSISAPLTRYPTIAKRDVNLYNLFRQVVARGGYDRIASNPRCWEEILSKLGRYEGPTREESCCLLRGFYQEYLYAYEQHVHFGRSLHQLRANPFPTTKEKTVGSRNSQTLQKQPQTQLLLGAMGSPPVPSAGGGMRN